MHGLMNIKFVLFRIHCSLWNASASIQFGKDLLFRVYFYNRTHHSDHSVEQTYFISGSSVYHYINEIFLRFSRRISNDSSVCTRLAT
jgi:hypothetical protein